MIYTPLFGDHSFTRLRNQAGIFLLGEGGVAS